MKKITFHSHISLDGFVARSGGELEWIKFDDEMFDFVGNLTDDFDTALYGRGTFQIMDNYWPTAGQKPDASKHDIEHSTWYNSVTKYVMSTTITSNDNKKTIFIKDNIADNINEIKMQDGKNILMLGSPTAAHALLKEELIDYIWLFVNPIILGSGIQLFKQGIPETKFKLSQTKLFDCGVIALHYEKI